MQHHREMYIAGIDTPKQHLVHGQVLRIRGVAHTGAFSSLKKCSRRNSALVGPVEGTLILKRSLRNVTSLLDADDVAIVSRS